MNTSTHIKSLKKIAQTCLLLDKIIKKKKPTFFVCIFDWGTEVRHNSLETQKPAQWRPILVESL